MVFLGCFATAEEAALFYARREAGRDTSDLTAPPPPPPPPVPSSAAGAEAVRQAGREGLTLATSSNSNSGYRGVVYYPKERGSKKYKLKVMIVAASRSASASSPRPSRPRVPPNPYPNPNPEPKPKPNPNPSPSPNPNPNQAARALRDEYLALEAQPSDGGMGGERPVKRQPNPNPIPRP